MKRNLMTMMKVMFGAVLVVGSSACSGSEVLGEPMPPDTKAVPLSDLAARPKDYQGQFLMVEGQIGPVVCADCGGVLLLDKTWRVLVEPVNVKAFRIPPKKGARLKAWGSIVAAESEGGPSVPAFKAKGVLIQ